MSITQEGGLGYEVCALIIIKTGALKMKGGLLVKMEAYKHTKI